MDSFLCVLAVTCVALLSLTGGVLGAGEDCDTSKSACDMKAMTIGQKQPTTAEEIKTYCSTVRAVVTCYDGLRENCPNLDYTMADSMKQPLTMICGGNAGGPPQGGAPQGGAQGECAAKMGSCFAESGLSMDSQPSDEDAKTNKGGICKKISNLMACIQGCLQGVQEDMKTMFTQKADLCAPYTTEDETKENEPAAEDASPKTAPETAPETTPEAGNHATTILSSMLLFLMPVFLQAWILM